MHTTVDAMCVCVYVCVCVCVCVCLCVCVCMLCALYAAAVQLDNGAQVLSFCFILFLITVPDGSL